jgi:hypothetical protein
MAAVVAMVAMATTAVTLAVVKRGKKEMAEEMIRDVLSGLTAEIHGSGTIFTDGRCNGRHANVDFGKCPKCHSFWFRYITDKDRTPCKCDCNCMDDQGSVTRTTISLSDGVLRFNSHTTTEVRTSRKTKFWTRNFVEFQIRHLAIRTNTFLKSVQEIHGYGTYKGERGWIDTGYSCGKIEFSFKSFTNENFHVFFDGINFVELYGECLVVDCPFMRFRDSFGGVNSLLHFEIDDFVLDTIRDDGLPDASANGWYIGQPNAVSRPLPITQSVIEPLTFK